ncbi:C39 family peptidase [bacterium]|nr:C39 family peptidase [bacterium]
MVRAIQLQMLRQPDDLTCGPTCLHAVYRYFGEKLSLERIIAEVTSLDTGGTLAPLLGYHALKRGYSAEIYTCNLNMFDPIWFKQDRVVLAQKLIAQAKAKGDARTVTSTRAYLDFLKSGGDIFMSDPTPELICSFLDENLPVLAGLSATWLHKKPRERSWDDEYDDINGSSAGHFVVIDGYDQASREASVSDPVHRTSGTYGGKFKVNINRLVTAILLGVLSYDGDLLILKPSNNVVQE